MPWLGPKPAWNAEQRDHGVKPFAKYSSHTVMRLPC